jgi:transposase
MGREYTRQYKQQALSLVKEKGYTPTKAARDLGIPTQTLIVWLKKSGWKPPREEPQRPLSEDPAVLQVQVRELQAQVRRLEQEKDILKKATAYFASHSS